MYATWSTYNFVTDSGVKKEVLAWTGDGNPYWTSGRGHVNDYKYAARAVFVDGTNGQRNTSSAYGARPALKDGIEAE